MRILNDQIPQKDAGRQFGAAPALLLCFFLYLAASCFILDATRFRAEKPHAEMMRLASEQTARCFAVLKEERLRRGYEIIPTDDPNLTGMVGYDFTEITTSHGSLEAKRSTTNPNTAAMITDLLVQCGVKEGDLVAVNLSSSFPCLNVATLCALDALGAEGVIINSVGASTYGANLPGFVYLDMEQTLLSEGLIRNHSFAFSMGGDYDIGYGMPDQDLVKTIEDRIRGYGLQFLHYKDIDENLAARLELYLGKAGNKDSRNSPVSASDFRCLVNAGGNILAFGGGEGLISAKSGILRPGRKPEEGKGLIPWFLNQGVPVIHLLNMNSLLPENGLPFDPIPLPAPGTGDVYFEMRYRKELVLLLSAGALLILAVTALRFPRRHPIQKGLL